MKKFYWALYPLLTIVFIVASAAVVFKPESFEILTQNSQQTEEDQAKVEVLKQKLEVLTSVNPALETDRLRYLNSAVPSTKMVWFVVAQLEIAASQSGGILKEYTAGVGKGVSEATEGAKLQTAPGATTDDLTIKAVVQFADSDNMVPFFETLSKRLPLVMVSLADYDSGELNLTLISAWGANKKIVPGDQLPDYKTSVATAIDRLEGFVGFSEIEVATRSGSVVTNPF